MIEPAKNDLFFVGDGHQRIYGRNKAALSRCGIDIRGRSRKLYINYRTTDEIQKQALSYLEGCLIDDLDGGSDENQRYKLLSHGPAPLFSQLGNFDECALTMVNWLATWNKEDDASKLTTCIITSSKSFRDQAKKYCEKKGYNGEVIEANKSGTANPGGIYFSTMHRAKGLEFDRVIVIGSTKMLGEISETDDQRKLLYVAMTRAKRSAGLILC